MAVHRLNRIASHRRLARKLEIPLIVSTGVARAVLLAVRRSGATRLRRATPLLRSLIPASEFIHSGISSSARQPHRMCGSCGLAVSRWVRQAPAPRGDGASAPHDAHYSRMHFCADSQGCLIAPPQPNAFSSPFVSSLVHSCSATRVRNDQRTLRTTMTAGNTPSRYRST